MQVDLQPRREQHLSRWKQLEADPELVKLPFKIETDRFDRILISPRPFFRSRPLYRHDHGAIALRRSSRHQSRLWLTYSDPNSENSGTNDSYWLDPLKALCSSRTNSSKVLGFLPQNVAIVAVDSHVAELVGVVRIDRQSCDRCSTAC